MPIDYSQFLPVPPSYTPVEIGPEGFFMEVYGVENPPLVAASEAMPEDACIINGRPASIMSRTQVSRRRKGKPPVDYAVKYLTQAEGAMGQPIFFEGQSFASELP